MSSANTSTGVPANDQRTRVALGIAADVCTWLRIALAPVFAWALASEETRGAAFALSVVAVVTDFADGRLARAGGRASDARRIFDHGADIVFLLPGLALLAHLHRTPVVLTYAAGFAFGLYAFDGWRRARGRGFALVPSRPGAAAGIANYAVALLATGALWLGSQPLVRTAYAAGIAAAALNLAAAFDRVQTMLASSELRTRA